METLAITGGGIHGSLSDPVVWLMIVLVGWIAINKVSWWAPVGVAAIFAVAQTAINLKVYQAIGASALERGLWQFWLKLIICLAMFGIVRLSIAVASRARTSA